MLVASPSSPAFSLTRRHFAGRALSGYVQGEVRTGRAFVDVLDDARVRDALTTMPELFDDLMEDRELRELVAPDRDGAIVVVGYDGSRAARRALAHAARALPGARALVVTVWESEERTAASARADEGAALARALGMEADAHVARRSGDVWDTIVRSALLFEADLAVIGTRARPCTRALAEESVAHRAISERRIPVLVVPDDGVLPAAAPPLGNSRPGARAVAPDYRLEGVA
jgi:nucleotide-binding universal stress UspA family protein